MAAEHPTTIGDLTELLAACRSRQDALVAQLRSEEDAAADATERAERAEAAREVVVAQQAALITALQASHAEGHRRMFAACSLWPCKGLSADGGLAAGHALLKERDEAIADLHGPNGERARAERAEAELEALRVQYDYVVGRAREETAELYKPSEYLPKCDGSPGCKAPGHAYGCKASA